MEISAASSSTAIMKQSSVLLKSFEEEERKEILQNVNNGVTQITAEEMLDLKSDMGLPWEKIKTMSR